MEHTIKKTLPIEPSKTTPIIVPVERWHVVGKSDKLVKKYGFVNIQDRALFVLRLMQYELSTQHPSTMVVDGDSVVLNLSTSGIDKITELDKEYARYADVLYRDIMYSKVYDD